MNPEFLREGTLGARLQRPAQDRRRARGDPRTADTVASLYDGLPGVVHRVPIAVAEMTKYADNSFHALKIGFANEMGAICQAYGVDSHAVMEVFASDTKLNISRAYLRPGFAFGGSCLPEGPARDRLPRAPRRPLGADPRERHRARTRPHLRRVYDRLLEGAARRVALLGLAFKQGTDDLRESPMVELAERLLGTRLRPQHPRRARAHLAPHRARTAPTSTRASRTSRASWSRRRWRPSFGAEVVVLGEHGARVGRRRPRVRTDALLVDLVRRPELAGHAGGYLGAAW